MRRLVLALFAPVALAAGLALADSPAPPAPQERLLRFQRNQALVEKLVAGGLHLAAAADPLGRAAQCNRLAQGVVDEIQLALAAKDRPRADRLGRHLEALVVRGVVGNLRLACDALPADSPRRVEVRKVGDQALAAMLPLETALEQIPGQEQEYLQGVVQALSKGRAEVQRAARDRAPAGKGAAPAPPPAGKKLKAPSQS